MGLFDWIRSQFIDVIEWLDDSRDTIVYRYPRYQNEIKQGAKLIVRPSQAAVFVSEGEIADVLGPGTYILDTKNLPVLTNLQHWDHGFESPFKAEVYFVSTRRFGDLRWGTKNPIIINDPALGPVRIRAFGSYEIRVEDPAKLIKEVAGTDGLFTTDELKEQLSNLILSHFPEVIAKSGISLFELARHYKELGDRIKELLQPYFDEYGLKLEKLLIENLSVPKEVEKALDERSAQRVIDDLDDYLKYKGAQGLEKGGSASDLVGLGAGMAMAEQMFKKTPPPLEEDVYYIAVDGKPQGPYDKKEIEEMIAQGSLKRDQKVWKEGMPKWQEAEEVLGDLFRKVPPPIDG
ncbi:MAG: antifreeze protein [Epsilonproteobacteria bacterium]|nr:antifreeze protein [Campylobacterota bacterium]NPA63789.1 SPFH domain-containing protein [Campylobacterota bacterium]